MAVDTWNAKAYSPVLMTSLQRLGGLMQTVEVESGLNNAEFEFRDGISPVEMDKIQGRLQNTNWEEIGKYRRRISRVEFTKSLILDRNDHLDWIVQPDSNITQELGNGAKRAIDDDIISNIIGTAYTGKEGGTSVGFDANNIVTR